MAQFLDIGNADLATFDHDQADFEKLAQDARELFLRADGGGDED